MKILASFGIFWLFVLLLLGVVRVTWVSGNETFVVQYTYPAGECVRVLPHGSCDDLPKRFVKEWVAERK